MLRYEALMARITYHDWRPRVHKHLGLATLQICTIMKDAAADQMIENNGRCIHLCPEMSDEFIVDLIFELIKEFELHEVAEHFRLDGKRVYFPHDPSGKPLREVPALRTPR
jgi:hypothetical protein